METLLSWLIEQAPVIVVMGVGIYYLVKQLSKRDDKVSGLESELKEYSQDYRSLSQNSLKVLTLVDDKLKTEKGYGENIKEIHRIVGEILDIEKSRG